MRFFEFGPEDIADKLVIVLRNYIGRASSKKSPAKLNWAGLNNVLKTNGFDVLADYETFKAIYDSSPAIQNMVRDFNADGINLNVPGTDQDTETPVKQGETPADTIDKIASSAGPKQLAQNQSGIKV